MSAKHFTSFPSSFPAFVLGGLCAFTTVSCKDSSESPQNPQNGSAGSEPELVQQVVNEESQAEAASSAPENVTGETAKPKGQKGAELQLNTWKKEAASSSVMGEIRMMKKVVQAGRQDAETAVDFLANAPNSPRRAATLRTVTAGWVKVDQQAAMIKADSLSEPELQEVMRLAIVQNIDLAEAERTREWVNGWKANSPSTAEEAIKILDRLGDAEKSVNGPDCVGHDEHEHEDGEVHDHEHDAEGNHIH